jgi:hypothetical protein
MEFEGGSEMAFREGEMFRCCCCLLVASNAAHTSLKIHHAEERGRGGYYSFITWKKVKALQEGLKKLLRSRFKCFQQNTEGACAAWGRLRYKI